MTSGRSARGRRLGAYLALGALFLCATVAALSTLWTRHVGEQAMDEVAIVVDGLELAQWSAKTGESMVSLLARLRELGVTGVGVHEWTLSDAAQRGEVFIVAKATLRAMGSPLLERLPSETPDEALVIGWKEGIAPWLAEALAHELPHVAVPVERGAAGSSVDGGLDGGSLWLLVRSSPAFIVLGLNPEEVDAVRAAGLWVIPRLQGDAPESPDRLMRRLEAVRGEGFGPVLFKGTSVLGFPSFLHPVADALKAVNASIGLIEFAPQHGFAALAKEIGYDVVRVHSITDREMAAGIAPERAVDRWLRAVRERQIRLLYVRLYMNADDQEPSAWAAANLAYLEQLTNALRQAGYRLAGGEKAGPGPGFRLRGSAPAASPGTLAVIALAAGACAGWVAWTLLSRVLGQEISANGGLSWAVVGGTSLLALALGAGLWLKGYTVLARQGLALWTAVSFPVAAVWAALRTVERHGGIEENAEGVDERSVSLSKGLVPAIKGFAVALAIALVGAAFIAALLTEVRFLLKIEEFRGVKLAHVAPLAVLAAMLAAPGVMASSEAGGHGAPGKARPALGQLVRAWLSQSIRVWELLVLLGAGLILWVYLARTGNQGLPVPALEEALRRLLEESLYARPRTKELLIGHPALVAALVCWVPWARSRVRWRRLAAHALLLAGAVGQISILNTFAHAHSALAVSLVRTAYGVLFGMVIGVAAGGLIAWIDRRAGAKRHPAIPGGVSRRG